MEQLLHKGFTIITGLLADFLNEWEQLLPFIKQQNEQLAPKYDGMIRYSVKGLSSAKSISMDSYIFSLLTEWETRFSNHYDEYETISFITTIENIFHKLIAKNTASTFMDHQAVQAFFLRILDQSLLTRDSARGIEQWARMIMSSNFVPMKWLVVVKKVQEDYQINCVICSEQHQVDNQLIDMCLTLKAPQLDYLSVAVERLIGIKKGKTPIIQIPCINDTLLVCLQDDAVINQQQIDVIRGMYLRQLKVQHLENKIDWKNASLLFLQHLLPSRSAEAAVKAITRALVEYMPFKRCAIFIYNQSEVQGISVSGHNVSLPSIQPIREKIFQLPFIQKYLQTLTYAQPLYFSNASEVLPEKYIQAFKLKTLVVLPLYAPSKQQLLGIALLDQGEHSEFIVAPQTLTTLIKFGQYAGESLYSIREEIPRQSVVPSTILSQREREVLKLIAEGATISEAAKELHLSSYTVRDYVSIIIQKLSAKNRTDAAVKAIRMNIIS
ncbi:response regulator transcription factor [Neobacillus sp. Marseille-QA0830]